MASTTGEQSMNMKEELEELVIRIAPSKDIAGGFMSRNDIIQLITKVADDAALIGWAKGESMSRKRLDKKVTNLEQEVEILKDRIKDLELELIASSK
jgi:hypothetical protein